MRKSDEFYELDAMNEAGYLSYRYIWDTTMPNSQADQRRLKSPFSYDESTKPSRQPSQQNLPLQ